MRSTCILVLLALGVANSFRPSVRSSSASRATSRCFTPLPIVSSVAYRSFTPSMMNGPGGDDLESLFDQIKDLDPEDVPEDIQNAIRDRISENAPSDWKIRLNLMGFNPLTIAGYLLAAVILTCNNVLGAGWAGEMLGMNEVVVSDRTMVPQPRIGSNERFSNSYDGVIRTEIQTIELNNKENLL